MVKSTFNPLKSAPFTNDGYVMLTISGPGKKLLEITFTVNLFFSPSPYPGLFGITYPTYCPTPSENTFGFNENVPAWFVLVLVDYLILVQHECHFFCSFWPRGPGGRGDQSDGARGWGARVSPRQAYATKTRACMRPALAIISV